MTKKSFNRERDQKSLDTPLPILTVSEKTLATSTLAIARAAAILFARCKITEPAQSPIPLLALPHKFNFATNGVNSIPLI